MIDFGIFCLNVELVVDELDTPLPKGEGILLSTSQLALAGFRQPK
jgi:hypothetical protein